MGVYIREVAVEMGKKGHLVDIYTRTHGPEDEPIVQLGQNTRLIHLRAGEDRDIHKLMVYRHVPSFACNLENFRKRADLSYDLVVSHYWLSGCAGEYLQRWWNVPHVITFHTLGAIKNAIGIGENEPELRIETEKHLVRDCHRTIATTAKEKEELVVRYGALPDKIAVIPCGVNLDLFKPADKEKAKQELGLGDDKIVLYVGRIEPLKGVDQLLRAMTYLQNGQRIKLLIVGGDENSREEIERLQKLSQALHVERLVAFPGMIKHNMLPRVYSAADVCVIPSYYESFGLVPLESLACGTPVVATDVGDLENIVRQGETGYVVRDNAPYHLAEKIALVLSRSRSGTESAGLIRESVTGFGWSNIARRIVEQYREVTAHCG
jgi:D-inositol-3-phosphate glycosyltransferase